MSTYRYNEPINKGKKMKHAIVVGASLLTISAATIGVTHKWTVEDARAKHLAMVAAEQQQAAEIRAKIAQQQHDIDVAQCKIRISNWDKLLPAVKAKTAKPDCSVE